MLPPLLEKLWNGSGWFGCLTLVCPRCILLHQFLCVRTMRRQPESQVMGESWLVMMCITSQSKPMSCNQLLAGDIWLYVVWAPPITRPTIAQKCFLIVLFIPILLLDLTGERCITPLHLAELIHHNRSMWHAVLHVSRNEEDSGDDRFCPSACCICPSVHCKFPNLLHFPTCS